MSTIIIKSGTTAIAGATVKGSFSYFSGSTKDLGPTSTTGFYSGVDAPAGGYSVYQTGGPNGFTVRVATDTTSLNSILIQAGATGSTTDQRITWATNTNSVWINSGTTASGPTSVSYSLGYTSSPWSIGIYNGDGTVYVADTDGPINKVTSGGTVTSAWQTPNVQNQFGCAVDSLGNVYTTATSNVDATGVIIKITPAGSITTYSVGISGHPYSPNAIIVDRFNSVYAVDQNNNVICKVTSGGTVTSTWASVNGPAYMCFDSSGNMFVACIDDTVAKITPAGAVTQPFATLTTGGWPNMITIDSSNNLYITNNQNSTISKVTPAGAVTTAWVTTTTPYPLAITCDSSNNLYVTYANVFGSETYNNISKITSSGTLTNNWITLGSSSYFMDVKFNNSNKLYALDFVGGILYKITP
jgi:hypothetical protein